MNTKSLGIVISAIGILMIIYTGFNYVTNENVIDIGPMHMTVEENHPVQWSPIVGAILLVGGIAIVATNRKK